MSTPDRIPFTRKFVYTGSETDAAGKRFMGFVALDDDGATSGRPIHFAVKRGAGYRFAVGHVYLMSGDASADGQAMTLALGKAEWQEEFRDGSKVAEWQARSLAAERTARAKALEKREAIGTSRLDELMEPLRRAYNRLPIMDRPAFELWMLTNLRKR